MRKSETYDFPVVAVTGGQGWFITYYREGGAWTEPVVGWAFDAGGFCDPCMTGLDGDGEIHRMASGDVVWHPSITDTDGNPFTVEHAIQLAKASWESAQAGR